MSVIPDQNNVEIPVTAIPYDLAVMMIEGAKGGGIYLKDTGHVVSSAVFFESLMKQKVPKLLDPGRRQAGLGIVAGAGVAGTVALCLTPIGPLVFAAWLIGTFAVPLHTSPRACTIIILNFTEGALKWHSTELINGLQTGHPVITDGTSKFAAAADSNVIPGILQINGDLYPSVGVYQFQKDLQQITGFVGTAGALSLDMEDPKHKGRRIGIAWNVPEGFWDDDDRDPSHIPTPGLGITCDLLGDYGVLDDKSSLDIFYTTTAAAPTQKVNRYESKGGVSMHACLFPRVFDKTTLTYDPEERWRDLVLTVVVQ